MPLKETDLAKAFVLFVIGSVVFSFLAVILMGVLAGVTFHAGSWRIATINVGALVMGVISSILITYGLFRAMVLRYIVRRLIALMARQNGVSAA